MRRTLRVLLAATAFAAPALAGASGQLDPGFAGDGVLVLDASDVASATERLFAGLVDRTGRYVGVGLSEGTQNRTGLVMRLQPSGALDPSFGSGGIVRMPQVPGYSNTTWAEVREMEDGRLVVAGRAQFGFSAADPGRVVVCRLLENGALDASFDMDGCAMPAFAAGVLRDSLTGMALQPDGRIVLLGQSDVSGDDSPSEWIVARLDANGSYDECFGDAACQAGGVLVEPEPESDVQSFFPWDLALAPDGRIVVVGSGLFDSQDFAVIRLMPGGAVDAAGFGNQGHRLVAFDLGGLDADSARAVAVREDGAIFLAGLVQQELGYVVGVAALDPLGAPLPGFGEQGRMTLFFNDVSPIHTPTRIALQADGKLVVGGEAGAPDDPLGEQRDCGVARVRGDGTLDPAFGFAGVNGIDAGRGLAAPRADQCQGLALDARRVLLFGSYDDPQSDEIDALVLALDRDGLFGDGFEE